MISGKRAVPLLLLVFTIAALIAACTTTPVSPNSGFVPNAGPTPAGSGNNNANVTGGNSGSNVASNPGGGLPANAPRPQPPTNSYGGCPSTGDGGDPGLNIRKNRTDSAPWYPVSIGSLVALPWPKGVEKRQRASWSAGDATTVARNEGTPIQVEGWLAGAKQEGPESCNCHSPDDVDNHLWIVDSPSKDRSQSVVIEITPRMRALHPGWAFSRIRPLVDGQTQVRISGWLLMDQEHPDQVGKTRGTIWEIHPIIAFDVRRGNDWISLDTGRVSTTNTAPGGAEAAAPTEDPSLPPPITEPLAPGALPTATSRPQASHSGGTSASKGDVVIDDIFYNGTKGQTEPDEYVEITNRGRTAINLEGWVLRDIYGGQEFTWHNYTLAPGRQIRVYTDEVHADSGGFSFGSHSAIWGNKGDAAELQDAGGTVVSTFAYGDKR